MKIIFANVSTKERAPSKLDDVTAPIDGTIKAVYVEVGTMVAKNQLREIGLRPESGGVDAPWSRPALANPAPVPGMPRGLAMIPAAVAMMRWKLQGRDK